MNRKKDIEQLFRQHYAKMYNLARCILSDDDESKDVVSEVFAQILADDVVLVPGSEDGYLMRSAGASGRASLRAAGAAKLLLRTKTQTTLSPNKL